MQHEKWLISIFLVFIVGTVSFAAENRDAMQEEGQRLLEQQHALSMDLETPHTKWAKPYVGGTIRVLYFTTWFQGSTDGREIIELMQRFDIEADAVYCLSPSRILGDGNPRWYGDMEAGSKRVLRLLETPYDVILFNKISFDKFPEQVQAKLVESVHNGTGLYMAGDLETPPMEGEYLKDTPGLRDAYQAGKGLILLEKPRGKLEYKVGWETTLDYQLADQGYFLYWLAGKKPVHTYSIENSLGIGFQKKVVVTWDKPRRGVKLRVRLRRWDGESYPLGEVKFSRKRRAEFPLPPLRTGSYQVDFFTTNAKGVEHWGSQQVLIDTKRRVDAVRLEQDWVEIGDTIKGEAHCSGLFEEGDTVLIRLLDKRGRILKQQARAREDILPFSFPVEAWFPMLLRVEAVVVNDGNEISANYAYCRVTKRHRDQFHFMMWNYPGGDLAPYGLESFAENGVTSILQGGEPPLMLSASEHSYVPYAASFRKSSHTVTAMLDEAGVMKDGCLHDEEKMAAWVNSSVEHCQTARKHGVFVYSLGDENAVRGACLSPICLKAYQTYLKEIYGDIAALNASWDSNYASFEAIRLLENGELPADDAPQWFKEFFAQRWQKNITDSHTTGEAQLILGDINDELRALQAENYARWYDRQAFQNHTYVEWCKRFKTAFAEMDPQALTGFEGTDSFTLRRLTTRSRQGGDLDAFVRELDYFGPYGGPANEVVRSIAKPDFPMGNWIGYTKDSEVLLKYYWQQVTNGMNTIQWWRWDNLDGYAGFLAPTLSPSYAAQPMLDDTRIVREGLGTLLMQCVMQDDGVAMLYSMPSTHIAHFDGNRSYGNYKRDHDLWHKMLHDSGVQFRYVTDRMLRLGEFDASRYKVLILPMAVAMSPEEAEAIRSFVHEGGTVIADVRPATYTGRCKPLEEGLLDDLFGIQRSGKQDAVSLDRMRVSGEVNGEEVYMEWGNWYGKEVYPQMHADPTVTVTTGKKLGQSFPIHYHHGLEHPACVINEYGAGRAILLNFPIYNAPAQPLIQGLLASAGVKPVITAHDLDGNAIPGLEVTRWKNGDSALLALLGDNEGSVSVTLPEAYHVYDLKAGRDLGQVQEFVTSVRPHRASFFALLPEAPALELRLTEGSVAPGTVATAELSMRGASGKHAVRIIVTDPKGHTATWLTQTVIADQAVRTITLPIAYNDPTGDWILHATDLLTQQQQQAVLTVQ